MRSMRTTFWLAALIGAAACSDQRHNAELVTGPEVSLRAADGQSGAVFVATNQVAANAVWAYERAADGALSDPQAFPTGGTGTGAGLGSQGGLVLSSDGRWLLVVNAGSNDVSVFAVEGDELELADRAPSGGILPVSIAVHERLVYVLNAGGAGNVSGFALGEGGRLRALSNSTRPLSSTAAGPAQAEFSPDGRTLVVTEKATNKITLYAVDEDGRLSTPRPVQSVGATPFGFAFSRSGTLIVSEAFGGAPGASALSSYRLSRHGLQVISRSVGTTQTAACWVVVTENQRFAYTSNTGSGTISGYLVSRDGRLSLLDSDGVTATTGAGPIDLALSRESRFLYSLDSGARGISGFRVGPGGDLTLLSRVSGLPAGANGLAAM